MNTRKTTTNWKTRTGKVTINRKSKTNIQKIIAPRRTSRKYNFRSTRKFSPCNQRNYGVENPEEDQKQEINEFMKHLKICG